MDYTEILNAISTVGFPIACCCYMVFNNNKTLQELSKAVNSLHTLINEFLTERSNSK